MHKFGFRVSRQSVSRQWVSRLCLAACLAGNAPTFAQEADNGDESSDIIVVTASRSGDGVDRNLIGSSVTVIDTQQVEERETRIVSDVLRDVPGVAVSRAGAVGGLTQIRIRGTEGNHVLMFVDGIKASSPYQGEFDFGALIADDAARIEVLRGQQSALYGSDAIGGVINYTTLSGREAPGIRLRAEGGSFGTYNGTARVAGTVGDTFDYALSGSFFHTDGYPTAPARSVSVGPDYTSPTAPGIRDVGSESAAASAKFNWTPGDAFRLSGVLRYGRTKADLNDSSPWGGPVTIGQIPVITTVDSDGVHYKDESWSGLLRAELDTFDGIMTTAASAQFVDSRRDSYDPFPYSWSDYFGNKGTRYRGSLENTVRFGSERIKNVLTLAIDAEREEYRNLSPGTILSDKHSFDTMGFVMQYNVAIDRRLSLGASVRIDKNDQFEDATTWHFDGSYLAPTGTRLHAAAGKGIKNPTATELFGYSPPFVGNPLLQPEQSEGWEAGVDQSFGNGLVTIGATYFKSKLTNWIQSCSLNGNSSVCNSGPISRQQGVELFGQARLGAVRIDLAYTHLDTPQTVTAVINPNNPVTGYGAGPSYSDPIPVGYDYMTPGLVAATTIQAVRRPENSASLNVSWVPENLPVSGTLTVRYNGKMKDYAFDTYYNYVLVDMKAFTLVNLALRYKLNDNVEFYARAENLLDEDYQEIFSFNAPGRAVYGGVRLHF